MKKIFAIVYLCAFALVVSAQTIDLPFPTDTVKGKVFYLYPVQKSEGLFRICKNFGVKQEDILNYNPDLKNQVLREGQILRIPLIERLDSSKYVIHEVQPKETFYGLGRKYKVKTSQLKELNPQLKDRSPQAGEKLLIKLKEDAENTDDVKQLAEVKGIAEAVKQLADTTKTVSDTLRTIPDTTKSISDAVKVLPVVLPSIIADTLQPVTVPVKEEDSLHLLPPTEPIEVPIRIAYLLPFMTETAKRDAAVDRFVEFYEGSLIAIEEAQKRGQKFEIYAYDTEKSENKLQKILQRPEMSNIDVIIGPAYPSQVAIVAKYCFDNKKPAIIPFTSKVNGLKNNPYLIQFNAAERREVEKIAEYLQLNQDRQQILIMSEASDIDSEMQSIYKSIKSLGVNYKQITEDQLNDSLYALLSDKKENIIFLSQTKYQLAEPLIGSINRQRADKSVRLFSQYSWQSKDITLPVLYTSVFNHTHAQDVARIPYKLRFGYYFHHEIKNDTPRYDLLGYDLTNWVVRMMQQDGSLTLAERILATDYVGLQSDIQFEQLPLGGFENIKVQVIEQ